MAAEGQHPPALLVAGKGVRMPGVVRRVVDDLELREPGRADDQHTEHNGHDGLGSRR